MDLEGWEIYIDPMVLNGVLAGVQLGFAGLWLQALRGALWRSWLDAEQGEAVARAQSVHDLVRRPSGLRGRMALTGTNGSGPFRLWLTASWGQPRAVLKAAGSPRRSVPLGEGADWLTAWLSQDGEASTVPDGDPAQP